MSHEVATGHDAWSKGQGGDGQRSKLKSFRKRRHNRATVLGRLALPTAVDRVNHMSPASDGTQKRLEENRRSVREHRLPHKTRVGGVVRVTWSPS